MTTRIQIIRSSTPGAVPAAGTRSPGELWTTFPDLQLGVIDASKNAQKLVGVRFFSTTANYAVGDFVIQAGVLYVAKVAVTAGAFNATQWTQVAAATDAGGPYLAISGGTLTGALILAADPGTALGAATKQYVDGKVGPYLPLAGGVLSGTLAVGVGSTTVNALTIIPGANPANANPAQINAFDQTSGVLIAGAWQSIKSGGIAVLAAQGNGSIIKIGQGSPNNLTFDNNANGGVFMLMDQTSANANPGNYLQLLNAPLGNPSTAVIQTAGGSANRSIQLVPNGTGTVQAPTAAPGTATTQIATTAFVAAAMMGDNRLINGNFTVNQRGQVSGTALAAAAYGHDRWKAGAAGCTYTFTAALPDTTVTITAGTLTQIIEAGMIEGGVYTLSWTGTAQARVYQGTPAGAYAASPIITAALPAGANTTVEFNAGTLTRVKLEIGSTATPFNRQSLAKSMADCQRYYQTGQLYLTGQAGTAGQTFSYGYTPPVVLRVPGPWALTILSNSNSNWTTGAVNYGGSGIVSAQGTAVAAGAVTINMNWAAPAEL
jgi:hypothetical protein